MKGRGRFRSNLLSGGHVSCNDCSFTYKVLREGIRLAAGRIAFQRRHVFNIPAARAPPRRKSLSLPAVFELRVDHRAERRLRSRSCSCFVATSDFHPRSGQISSFSFAWSCVHAPEWKLFSASVFADAALCYYIDEKETSRGAECYFRSVERGRRDSVDRWATLCDDLSTNDEIIDDQVR